MTNDITDVSEPLLQSVGGRIRDLRVAAGHSQKSFAEAAGMNNNYAWRVEAGRQNLNLKTLSRIAIALNMTMADLLKGIESDPTTVGTRPYQKSPLKRAI